MQSNDISSNIAPAALKLLQTLQNNGDISDDLANELRVKYKTLYERVSNTIENERSLLKKASELNDNLFERHKEFENKKLKLKNNEKELCELKIKLEKNVIEIQECETKIDMNIMEKESVERTNCELEEEIICRRQKSEIMLQPIIERLNTEIETLNDEILNTSKLFNNECKIRDEYNHRIRKCNQQLIEFERQKLHKRQRLIRQKSEPERLEIQCQVLMRKLDILGRKCTELNNKLNELNVSISEINNNKTLIDCSRYKLAESLMRLRDLINNKEREIDEIQRKAEHSKHKLEDAQELRMQLTIELNEKKFKLKRETDQITKLNRIFEDNKRRFELLRRKKESIKQLILPLEEEYDRSNKKTIDLNVELKRQNKLLIQLKEDIDIFISQYLNEEEREFNIKTKLKTMKQIIVNKELLIEENNKKEKLLKEKIHQINLEREQIIKQQTKLSINIHKIKQKYKIKEIFIMDFNKKCVTIVSNLKLSRKHYEIIKNQRNRYANLVANTYQCLEEMKEKIKIVENELEILRNENISKDTALTEEKRALTQAKYTCDQLRFELNKLNNMFYEKDQIISRYEINVNKLRNEINIIDSNQFQIVAKYKIAIQDRNNIALQLINRNDELSILYEKQNGLQIILNNGNKLIKEKDEIYKKLTLGNKDLERSLIVCRKKLLSDEQQKELAKQYCQLQILLKEIKTLSFKLSNELQIANPATNRYRKIKPVKHDASFNELQSNIAVLSSRLITQKEQLLEKELILDEVSQLTKKLKIQSIDGHQITLMLAKKMNLLQYNIQKITRQMMATVSELSMYQAQTFKLQNEKNNLNQLLINGHLLLNSKQAPFKQAEIEWNYIQRNRQQNMDGLYTNTDTTNPNSKGINHRDWTPSYDAIHNTHNIQQRPNAYIADDIGIPKPYGAHAPFKPTTLGANMRHIKKPQQKQVII